MFFFFFKQKTAYEIGVRLVGSEMCIRDSVEIVDEVGEENAFIFGLSSDEVINYENNGGYNPMDIFNSDMDIRKVLMQLINGFYSPDDPERFRPIYNSLLNTQETDVADRYFILKDFKSYAAAQKRVEEAYRNEEGWAKSAMLNVANAVSYTHLTLPTKRIV